MKMVGITRIRNVSSIIEYTLAHVSNLVDEIYVFDDCSTDDTIAICKKFPKVKRIMKSKTWSRNPIVRMRLEGSQRQAIFLESLKSNPDWVYYFDADEIAYFDDIDFLDKNISAYRMRLFDFYITEGDVNKRFFERKYMGPEFRDILTLFRPSKNVHFPTRLPGGITGRVESKGFIKHYGKAISINDWEEKCDYYINHLYETQPGNSTISEKWKKRKGRAIHTKSDFNRQLIEWEDRFDMNKIVDNSRGEAE